MGKFTYYLATKKVPDSENFYEGKRVCYYTDGTGHTVTIGVNGESYDDDEDSNNWYEIVFWKDGEELGSDVADIEGMTKSELQEFCKNELDNIIEEE